MLFFRLYQWNKAAMITDEMRLWEDLPSRAKLGIFAKRCLELAQRGVLDLTDLGLTGDDIFTEPTWSEFTQTSAVAYEGIFSKFKSSPASAETACEEEIIDASSPVTQERERAYERRQALRAPLQLFLKPESLEQEIFQTGRHHMLTEVVLAAPSYEVDVVDNDERLLAILRRYIFLVL